MIGNGTAKTHSACSKKTRNSRCAFIVKMFDKGDGQAADWPLLAETLLVEAFHALDQGKGDPRTAALLRQVEVGVYDRVSGNDADAFTPSGSGQGKDHDRNAPAAGVAFEGTKVR